MDNYFKLEQLSEPTAATPLGTYQIRCEMCNELVPSGLFNLARHRNECPCPGSHILVPGSEGTDAAIKRINHILSK
jgi:hypothetical protein